MAASFAEIVARGGVPALHCPMTGRVVFDSEEGFEPTEQHSPFLRFFIDWIGQSYAASPRALPKKQREYQQRVIEILQADNEDETQNDMVAKCVAALPESCIVMEILDPPAGGGFNGSICYACFDFSIESSELKGVKLKHVAG
jgi:hypothetical protein